MNVYTTCPTCKREALVEDGRQHHADCPPPPLTPADQMFRQFEKLVAEIAAPGHKPRQHDELNLAALQDKIDEHDRQPPRLGAAALWYVQHYGWPVFPLKPLSKVPATRNGFKDATTDPEQIKRWWTDMPNANIGLPTGHAFDVIDVDLPDGPASWEAMRNRPDLHGQVSTASGGLHAYILPTGRNNGARIWPGVDYRGMGGYVVGAPSWLGTKAQQWNWLTKPSPRIIGKPFDK